MDNEYDYLYKVCIVGPSGCGKTSLLLRLIDQRFPEVHASTIGVDFQRYTVDVQLSTGLTKRVRLQIWDTAGQERFRSVTAHYYRGCKASLAVFALDDPKSIEQLQVYLLDMAQHKITNQVLIGNKNDIEPSKVQPEQIAALFEEYPDMTYIATSAKTGENVEEVFYQISKELAELQASGQLLTDDANKEAIQVPSPREVSEVTRRACCGGTG